MTSSKLAFLDALEQLNKKPEPGWVDACRKIVQQAETWLSGPEFLSVFQMQKLPVDIGDPTDGSLHHLSELWLRWTNEKTWPALVRILPTGGTVTGADDLYGLLGRVLVTCGSKKVLLGAGVKGTDWVIRKNGAVPLTEDTFFEALTDLL